MAYNPSQNIPLSKPMGPVNFPVDGRELLYDSVNFKWRPYISTSEVFSQLPIQFRNVGLRVLINTGGTLSGGVVTGGTNEFYFFKNGVNNVNLVPGDVGPPGPPGPAGSLPTPSNESFLII